MKQSGSRSASRLPAARAAGVVGFHLRAPKSGPMEVDLTPSRIVHAIELGLPIAELEALRESLGIPLDRLATLLGISKATLHRRRTQGRLDPAESDRVVRFARLVGRAAEVLDGEENARRWLDSVQQGLGGVAPLDFAVTETGAREVEDLLGRIEFGVYS
ncbi:MAG: antitoxin Xre/MbcA/ParS toxin-binding domain-containing protein [Limisphaerales bacterium]